MKRKRWKAKEKLEIVLEGLRNQCSVSELCNRHGITQSMYYKWRDQRLKNGDNVFHSSVDQHTNQLEYQNKQLKALAGHLTLELKKRKSNCYEATTIQIKSTPWCINHWTNSVHQIGSSVLGISTRIELYEVSWRNHHWQNSIYWLMK